MAPADGKDGDELVPPDGGFGWVVVACVFSITFLSFGIIYSIGITFDVLIADFGCTKSEVTVFASIALCLQCFLGPFVSLLQRRYSTRGMVAVGIVIVSISFISSAFAPSVFMLYFTFGALGGFGMALIYLPVTVMVSFYFHRRRSLATALGGIGAYVGAFTHPYLIRFLISMYNWRGAFIILGALELNSLAAAILLRPVESRKLKILPEEGQDEGEVELIKSPESPKLEKVPPSDSSNALAAFIEGNIAGCMAEDKLTETDEKQQEKLPEEVAVNAGIISEGEVESMALSARESIVDIDRSNSVIEKSLESSGAGGGGALSSGQQIPQEGVPPIVGRQVSFTRRQFSQPRASSSSTRRKVGPRQISEQPRPQTPGDTSQGRLSASSKQLQKQISLARSGSRLSRLSSFNNLYTSDVFTLPAEATEAGMTSPGEQLSGSFVLARAPSRQRSKMSEHIEEEILLEDVKEAPEPSPTAGKTLLPAENVEPETEQPATKWQHFLKIVTPYVLHFRNPKFTSFFTTNFMKGLIYYTPSMFIVGWGKQLGMPVEQTTLLISLVGIGNIIGRPVMAFVSDLLADYRMALLALMVGINGTVTLLTPLFANFYYLAFFVFQFAFFIGGGQTLLTPILADMVPLSELGFAFGILIAAEGAAILIGPPMLGLFPTYPATFTAAGLIMLSSAVVLIVVAYIDRIFNLLCRCIRKHGKTSEEQKNAISNDA